MMYRRFVMFYSDYEIYIMSNNYGKDLQRSCDSFKCHGNYYGHYERYRRSYKLLQWLVAMVRGKNSEVVKGS